MVTSSLDVVQGFPLVLVQTQQWARGWVGMEQGVMAPGDAPGPAANPPPPPSRNPHGRDLCFDYFQIPVCVKFDLRKHFSPTCRRIEGV